MPYNTTKRPRELDFEVPDFKRPRLNIAQHASALVQRIPIHFWDALLSRTLLTFFRSKPLEHLPGHEDEEWTVRQYLGSGGFAHVALWVRRNADNDIVDEVVVKEETNLGKRYVSAYPNGNSLSKEALFQACISQRSENIAYLRGFRAYRRPEDVHEGDDQLCNMWRTYLEYAPHGDLDRLKNFYKVYYRYLPEAFLWHVFHSLAVAARALGPDDDLGSELENIGPDRLRFGQGHILHMDFKPKNILLGYQEPHVPKRTHGGLQTEGRVEDVPDYPMIKLSDFGVASWVTEGVYFHKSYGTPSYQPPEQLRKPNEDNEYLYGYDWGPHAPNGRSAPSLTPKMHIWNIGKVMLDLCTLADPELYEELEAGDLYQFQKNGNTSLADWNRVPFSKDRLHGLSPYSSTLTDLIRHCMVVKVEDRPSAETLIQSTSTMLTRCLRRPEPLDNLKSVENRKLYFQGKEIEYMPQGAQNCSHEINYRDYERLVRNPIWDPDVGPCHYDGMRPFDNMPQGIQQRLLRNEEDNVLPRYRERGEIQQDGYRRGSWIYFDKDQIAVDDPLDHDNNHGNNDIPIKVEDDADQDDGYLPELELIVPESGRDCYFFELERQHGVQHRDTEPAF